MTDRFSLVYMPRHGHAMPPQATHPGFEGPNEVIATPLVARLGPEVDEQAPTLAPAHEHFQRRLAQAVAAATHALDLCVAGKKKKKKKKKKKATTKTKKKG